MSEVISYLYSIILLNLPSKEKFVVNYYSLDVKLGIEKRDRILQHDKTFVFDADYRTALDKFITNASAFVTQYQMSIIGRQPLIEQDSYTEILEDIAMRRGQSKNAVSYIKKFPGAQKAAGELATIFDGANKRFRHLVRP